MQGKTPSRELVRVVGPGRQGTKKWARLTVSVLGARLGEEEGQVEVLGAEMWGGGGNLGR